MVSRNEPAERRGGPPKPPGPVRGLAADGLMNRLAAGQHGVVSTAQLRAAGVPPRVIQHRVRQAFLTRMHRGVYRVGPLVGARAAEMAGLLACGATSALSHGSAAGLHDLLPHSRPVRPVHVTVRRGRRVSRPGLRVHRSVGLADDEVTVVDGLRVTTPVRTIVDLAGSAAEKKLEAVVARADRAGLLDGMDVEAVLRRYAGRPGIGRLRARIQPGVAAAFTRSELEARFLALIRKAGLPEPATNVRVAGMEVDALWDDEALVAEVDGFGFHRGRAAFERDRRRDATLVAAGYRVARFTWTEVTTNDLVVVARLAQALGWARGSAAKGRTAP